MTTTTSVQATNHVAQASRTCPSPAPTSNHTAETVTITLQKKFRGDRVLYAGLVPPQDILRICYRWAYDPMRNNSDLDQGLNRETHVKKAEAILKYQEGRYAAGMPVEPGTVVACILRAADIIREEQVGEGTVRLTLRAKSCVLTDAQHRTFGYEKSLVEIDKSGNEKYPHVAEFVRNGWHAFHLTNFLGQADDPGFNTDQSRYQFACYQIRELNEGDKVAPAFRKAIRLRTESLIGMKADDRCKLLCYRVWQNLCQNQNSNWYDDIDLTSDRNKFKTKDEQKTAVGPLMGATTTVFKRMRKQHEETLTTELFNEEMRKGELVAAIDEAVAEQVEAYLLHFWNILARLNPEAFANGETKAEYGVPRRWASALVLLSEKVLDYFYQGGHKNTFRGLDLQGFIDSGRLEGFLSRSPILCDLEYWQPHNQQGAKRHSSEGYDGYMAVANKIWDELRPESWRQGKNVKWENFGSKHQARA